MYACVVAVSNYVAVHTWILARTNVYTYTTHSTAHTNKHGTSCRTHADTCKIFRYAKELVAAELPCSLRLLGVRVSHFRGGDTLGEDTADRAQRTLDSLWAAAAAKPSAQNNTSAAGTSHDTLALLEEDIEDEQNDEPLDDAERWEEALDHDQHLQQQQQRQQQQQQHVAVAGTRVPSIESTPIMPTPAPAAAQPQHHKRLRIEKSDDEKEDTKPVAIAVCQPSMKKPLLPAAAPVHSALVRDKRLPCPVCSELITALSTLEMEMHIDKCLLKFERNASGAVVPPPNAAAIRHRTTGGSSRSNSVKSSSKLRK